MMCASLALFFIANFYFDAYMYADQASLGRTYPGYLLAGVAVTLILLATLGSNVGHSSQLRYLGTISYGLYVYHFPVLELCETVWTHVTKHNVALLTASTGLPLTILLAGISYKYLEHPFIRLKERFATVKTKS